MWPKGALLSWSMGGEVDAFLQPSIIVCSAAIYMIMRSKGFCWAQGIQKVQVLESARCWFESVPSYVILSYLLNFSKLISSSGKWK